MSELRRQLLEDIFYPPHEPRKASAEYHRTHIELIRTRDEPCWICGIRHSDWEKLPKEIQPQLQLETHHAEMEWAAANGIDLDLIMADFPSLTDEAKVRTWLDSEGNMLVLCARHHRAGRTGIHSITYPAWKLQRWQGAEQSAHKFIPQPNWRELAV